MAVGQTAESFIYGTVKFKIGESRTGQLRWQKEEALWEDIFNAYKADLPILDNIESEQAQFINRNPESFDLGFMNLWEDRSPDLKYEFKIRFGDITRIEVIENKRANITLRNGKTIQVKDGANADINRKILLFDPQLGQLELPWNEIESIVFSQAPRTTKNAVGAPLFGRLLTTNGILEGFITWDREECVNLDLLGGKDNGLNLEIEFGRISRIKAEANGSLVTLRNGQEIFLNKHPDVSSSNRGIQVKTRDQGIITLEWAYFISIDFLTPPNAPASYNSFRVPSYIKGTVLTSSTSLTGRIVYDLDETWDIELLDGRNAGFYYYLPFYLIRSIVPQNYQFSLVELKTGTQLLLGNHTDVSNDSNGILVFPESNQPKYVPWVNVKQIIVDLEPN